ncbi:MAG: 5'/3'-nucleotidase SurE [Bacteroidales bacterium]
MEKRPTILITNDDGYTSKGINALIDAVSHLGDIIVVAPDGPRSGMSSAITITNPLRVTKVKDSDGVKIYKSTGTPVDCIKLALNRMAPNKPDMILSGINHGSNASVNVLYSGTMGAVLEGCIHSIPSIGYSIESHDSEADFDYCIESIRSITNNILNSGLPEGVCLNVNYPSIDKIKGHKVCRQAETYWIEEFEACKDPRGKNYYWLTGMPVNSKPHLTNTDDHWLSKGYATIVPTKIDLTADEAMKQISESLKID